MEHVRAIAIKLLMIGVIMLAVLTLFGGVDAVTSVYIAIVTTIAAYIIGDLLTLPTFGNLTASIADGIIAFLVAWLTPFVVPGLFISLGLAIAAGALVGVGEWFFHKYFRRTVLTEEKNEG